MEGSPDLFTHLFGYKVNWVPTKEVSRWADFPVWLRVLAVVAIVNFATYLIIAVKSGGDAWNGYSKAGRYFLASHGTYTEVSKAFWTYSYYHTIAVWATHGVVFIGMAVFLNSKRRGRRAEPDTADNSRPAA